MIKANEIRIGNWVIAHNVSRLNYNERVQISGIQPDDQVWYHPSDEMDTLHFLLPCEELEPIPLTPEILEKCGFVGGKTEFQMEVLEVNNGEARLYSDYVHGVLFNFPCQYLHQLQNLIYALTGTELEISLP